MDQKDLATTGPFEFTEAEKAQIQQHVDKYPDRKSAIMPALWIAQEKFGWLSEGVMRLVSETLDVPYALTYGVASFYTMYFKKRVPKHLIEICTAFSCYVTGGPEMHEALKEIINADDRGFAADGKIWIREAECLGACDTAPMCQISNRRYAHHLTKEKLASIVEKLRNDEDIPYEQIPLYDQSKIDS